METYQEFIQNILETRGRFACGDKYHERHHILPKCMDGTNDEDNLIDLFAREHFEAHRLLALENPDNDKLVYAWWMMSHIGRVEITAEEYQESKEAFDKINHGENHPNYGKHHSEESRNKISESISGESNPMYGVHRYGEYAPYYGKHHSEETRKKMSETQKERLKDPKNHPNYGKSLSDETRNKISQSVKEAMKNEEVLEKIRKPRPSMQGEGNPNYGKHLSKEQKEKMLKGFQKKCSGKDHPNYGKHLSEETKRKISEANKNPSEKTRRKMSKSAKARCTDEWKEKMRNFRKGVPLTEEHRQHIISGCLRGSNNPSARSIVQLNKEDNHIIKQWEYATLASNELGIDLSLIIRCCKGKAKTAGGFNWEYAENYQNNITLKES